MMLPPVHGPCERLAALEISIGDSWSDEELVRFLAERKAGDPLPLDVLAGVDCSAHDPRGFTGSVWHLKLSDGQQYDSAESGIRNAEKGYWKPVNSSRIPTSTAIIGVKIILEFYEGQAPGGERTGWVMHEYQVEQNDEANLPQDYKSLCKVFLQGENKMNPETETQQNSLNAVAPNDTLESYLRYLARTEEPKHTISATEQDVSSSKGQNEQEAQSDAHAIDSHDIIATGDYIELNDLLPSSKGQHEQKTQTAADDTDNFISDENYIELNDLLSSEASASTSEYSSKRSMISEEYFDSDAFLRDILKDSNTTDGQNKDHKFSIAAPTESTNVVIRPSEQGLVQIHDNTATVAGTSQQKPVPGGDRDQDSSKGVQQQSPSISSCFSSSHVKRSRSSSSNSSQNSIKSPRERSTSKFGKMYCCFGSFESSP